ncbi:uracil-DNA glycosylase family protein [Litorimonas sp. RW-G-Af-16]
MTKTVSNYSDIADLKARIRACTVCAKSQSPLPVTPNPIVRGTAQSKIRIISQAPGNLAHQSGEPFYDPSGARLREWLGVNSATFYNEDNFAITPMGFCFPGYDKHGGDLPPRKECAPLWQDPLTAHLQGVELTLLVGMYAMKAYLGRDAHRTLTETVRHWRDYGPNVMPLPHPSWRNNGWIKRHDWFGEALETLKRRVDDLVLRQDAEG